MAFLLVIIIVFLWFIMMGILEIIEILARAFPRKISDAQDVQTTVTIHCIDEDVK